MHGQQEPAVEDRPPWTLHDMGGGGPLADSDHRAAVCERGFDELQQIFRRHAAIGIDEGEPFGVRCQCPGLPDG